MFLKIVMNYLLGYINISVEGYFIERFINICISKKILLWNLKRKKSSFLYANIGIRDFKKIKEIAKTTKCRVMIEAKKGIPFLLHRYKKRKLFVVFLLVVTAFILGMSGFIWNIEVTGNNTIPTSELTSLLNNNGLNIGMLKQKVDTKNIINTIRLQRGDIAWIGIKIHGTNVIVEVVEAAKKPEIVDAQDYCNIVSDKDGIVTKINAENGTALVKEGDVVKKGTVLIGGWLEGKYTGTRYVPSQGEIQAKVWYSKKEKIALKQEVSESTGKEKNTYSIQINNLKINLPKRVPNFENYDTINENKKLKLFSNFYFPIEFCKTTYKEVKKKEVIYSVEEAKAIVVKKLEEELKNQIKDTNHIVDTQIHAKEENGEVEIELIYEVLENIGTKEKILF